MTSERKPMERAYYVVTDDSDRDANAISLCDSQTDDVTRKCSSQKSATVSFRLLRAHPTGKRHRPKGRHRNTAVPPMLTAMTSFPVPVANSHDDGPDEREKEEIEYRAVTPVRLSRKEVCVSFFKRLLAFLLSTVGLSILTVVYSVIGGLLFAAVEAPHEERVKSGVHDSIDRHVTELWQLTANLNVLHQVTACTRSKTV